MAAHKSHPKTADIKTRQDWILNYIRTVGPARFTDPAFFDAYVETFGVSSRPEAKGELKCRTLSKDLAEMLTDGRLSAVRVKNAYTYSLAKESV